MVSLKLKASYNHVLLQSKLAPATDDPSGRRSLHTIPSLTDNSSDNRNSEAEDSENTQSGEVVYQIGNLIGGLEVQENDKVAHWRVHLPVVGEKKLRVGIDNKILIVDVVKLEETTTGRRYGLGICLPDDTKDEQIKAEIKNGVLNVVFPKN